MKRILIAILLLIGLMSAFAVLGHHSAAGVDRSKTVTVEGTVKQFKWGNPHAWLDVEVPNSKGGADVWSFEMTSPTFLVRAGWKATSVKAGDKVTTAGGIRGTIISIKDDAIIIKVAPDGIKMEIAKNAIASVTTQESPSAS